MSKPKLSVSSPDLVKNVKAKQDIVVTASTTTKGAELVKTVK